MCINMDGHHSGGSSFVYVNDFCYYGNCLYNHRYKFSSEKKKKGKESQYIVSHPELGSDPPFESDRESGCDNNDDAKGVNFLQGKFHSFHLVATIVSYLTKAPPGPHCRKRSVSVFLSFILFLFLFFFVFCVCVVRGCDMW